MVLSGDEVTLYDISFFYDTIWGFGHRLTRSLASCIWECKSLHERLFFMR